MDNDELPGRSSRLSWLHST